MTSITPVPPPLGLGDGLRRTMAAGPAYGVFLVSGNAMLAEAARYTGIDWAVLDLEAAPMTKVDALHQAQALAGADLTTIIRVPSLDRHNIEYALDLGVAGVLVPKVDRIEDAELAARYTHYPPDGARGVNAIRASAYYSQSAQYYEAANRGVLCIVQIESREALRNVDKIAATVGVDMLFIGANDLAMDLGQPGNPTGPAFDAAREAVLAACADADKPAGIFALSTKLARQYAKEGFRFIAIGNEVKFFVQSAALTVNMLRK
jgi:2-keto-3-deoxy-L-rhamnonate aldolase RhmA